MHSFNQHSVTPDTQWMLRRLKEKATNLHAAGVKRKDRWSIVLELVWPKFILQHQGWTGYNQKCPSCAFATGAPARCMKGGNPETLTLWFSTPPIKSQATEKNAFIRSGAIRDNPHVCIILSAFKIKVTVYLHISPMRNKLIRASFQKQKPRPADAQPQSKKARGRAPKPPATRG